MLITESVGQTPSRSGIRSQVSLPLVIQDDSSCILTRYSTGSKRTPEVGSDNSDETLKKSRLKKTNHLAARREAIIKLNVNQSLEDSVHHSSNVLSYDRKIWPGNSTSRSK